jgi:uncharacterized membrane protein
MIIGNNLDLTIYGANSTDVTLQNDKVYEIDSLFIALLTNGDASVDYNLVVNSSKADTSLITNVTLFGETVQNLTLTDYNETNVKYLPTEQTNQISVFSQAVPNIHVTYTTPDLVDKKNRNWTFSFTFPDKFLLKMPSQAHVIDMEPPAFLTPTDEQNLWGFGPGKVKVSYVIGPLGTREEAQASMRGVQEAMKDARLKYNHIVLNNVTLLFDTARSNLKQGKYLETVTYSNKALNLLQNTGQEFVLANNSISQAENNIENKRNNGFDTTQAERTLITARKLFESGEYKKTQFFAKQILGEYEPKLGSLSLIETNFTFIAISIIAVSIFAIVISLAIKKRQNTAIGNIGNPSTALSSADDFQDSMEGPKDNLNIRENNAVKQNGSPVHFMTSDSSNEELEVKNYLDEVVKEVANVRKNNEVDNPANLLPNDHLSNRSLAGVVSKMKSDKPYLRNEDKDLLDFLREKEGSAFESEIRIKFVLPRTSLWRLIKRLEREELVEIRKIGGQNLIKLRIDG